MSNVTYGSTSRAPDDVLHDVVRERAVEHVSGVTESYLSSLTTLGLKGVGNLPRKTELKLYFELELNRLSVERLF